MVKLYTSLNVSQYSEILKTKNLHLINLDENTLGLEFTEDKKYWVQALQAQEDLENVSDYKYSLIIEFEIDTKVLNPLMESKKTGRFSQKIIEYYKTLNKVMTLPQLSEDDTNVLAVLYVYESDETDDGVSQKWMIKAESENSEIWQTFLSGIHKVSCLGGIPGAAEEAKKLLS